MATERSDTLLSHFSKYYKEITEKLAESKNLKSEIKSSIINSIDGMKKIVKEQSEIIKKNEFVLLTNIESQNCKQLDAIIDIKCELNNIKSIVSISLTHQHLNLAQIQLNLHQLSKINRKMW